MFLDVLDEISGGPDGLRERRVAPVDFWADKPVRAHGAINRRRHHLDPRRKPGDVRRLPEEVPAADRREVRSLDGDESDG